MFEEGFEIETPGYKRLLEEHGEIEDKLEELEEKYNLSEGQKDIVLAILKELETQRDSLINSLEKLVQGKHETIINDLNRIIDDYKKSSD